MDPRSFPRGIDVQWSGATVMRRRMRRLTRGCVPASMSAGFSSTMTIAIVPPCTDAARLHLPARPYICIYLYFSISVWSRSSQVHPLFSSPLAVLALPTAQGRLPSCVIYWTYGFARPAPGWALPPPNGCQDTELIHHPAKRERSCPLHHSRPATQRTTQILVLSQYVYA